MSSVIMNIKKSNIKLDLNKYLKSFNVWSSIIIVIGMYLFYSRHCVIDFETKNETDFLSENIE